MKQQTAVEWLIEEIHKNMGVWIPQHIQEQAKVMDEEQTKNAMMYTLDEDGHTGDWKISVAQKYYNEKHLGITGLSD